MADDFEPALTGDMEPELVPGNAEPAAAGQDDDHDPSEDFEAGSPAMPLVRRTIPRTDATRKALADTIAKFASEKIENEDEDEGGFGAYDEGARPAPKQGKPAAAKSGEAAAAPVAAAPPAPSLDPEVTRLRQELAQRAEQLEQREQALSARETDGQLVNQYDEYVESSSKAYRRWLETMRGEKFTDDDFKAEVADFVTLLSADVLGVPLPDTTRSHIESQQAKKTVKAFKMTQARREASETKKRAQAEEDAQYAQAATLLTNHVRTGVTKNADGTDGKPVAQIYPWLATEDNPGALIVDTIRSVQRRDGTKLSWQEASKRVNDYISQQASGFFDKRKHLLNAAPTAAGAQKQEQRPGRPPGTSQVTRTPHPSAPTDTTTELPVKFKPGSQWSKEAHRQKTRATFAGVFKPEE